MTRPILLVLALEQENHEQKLDNFADEILYTGVGKVNATFALTQKLLQMPVKPLVDKRRFGRLTQF
jgi:adenosylhomocysteine nucleosidase